MSKRVYVKGPLPKRFWAHVIKSDGCWNWNKPNKYHGYGEINNCTGKVLRANRVSWEIHFGPIPNDLFVLHKCDNRACVNPDHLFLGSQSDNMTDCSKKGRTNGMAKSMKGEKHPGAKLNWSIVDEIRASNQTSTSLAKKFGVDISTVCFIRKGKLWKEETRPNSNV